METAKWGPHKTIAWLATALFLLITLTADGPATYRFAIFFLAPLLWGVYFIRACVNINAAQFAIFAGALVLHNLGAFGAYRNAYLGIEFDIYVHFIFGLAGALIIASALRHCFTVTGWQLCVGTILLVLGIGAVHELIEYASTLILGPEKGMLKINHPDKFDTHKDLLNNLLGAVLGFVSNWFFMHRAPAASAEDPQPRPRAS